MKTLLLCAIAAFLTSSTRTPQDPLAIIAGLSPAHVAASGGELVIELPPVDVPARNTMGEGMVLTRLYRVPIPVSGTLYRFHVEVVDTTGQRLPQTMLHHVNLTDPHRRELFVPTSLHLVAASKETPSLAIPRFLFGLPIQQGDQYIASGMLANDGDAPVHGARIRLVFHYLPAWVPGPVFDAYPWVMDVMFPLGRPGDGRKAFDLPPGKLTRSWESRPAIPGTLLGLGGHIHDYGVSLTLEDVTAGKVLWHGEPVEDSSGTVHRMPVHRFYGWNHLGVHIEPSHVYRATVVYDNPTGQVLHDGGMGAVAGLFVPDRGTHWPRVDPADSIYLRDLEISIGVSGPAGPPHVMHGR
jgi:hypothetical protein